MKQTNEVFLAFILAISLASVLAALGFILQRPDVATQHIYEIASSLVTGGLGFFMGRSSAKSQPAPTADDSDSDPQQ